MKKRVLITVVGLLGLLGGVLFANSSVSTDSDCPNRCWDNGDGCVCNGYWECYYEPFLDGADDISGFYW